MVKDVKNWRQVHTVEDAQALIERGIVLKREDARLIARRLGNDKLCQIMREFANRCRDYRSDRLSIEIAIESALIIMVVHKKDELVYSFLDQFFLAANLHEACWNFVIVALNFEATEKESEEDIFSMAVLIICEMGFAVLDITEEVPGAFKKPLELLHHIATYLLSVSNSGHPQIRLCLIHYFGNISKFRPEFEESYNRVLNRFGNTVLEQLFDQLFSKKGSTAAFQYLCENLPFIILAKDFDQRLLFETFKQNLLKYPERFTIFINEFVSATRSSKVDIDTFDDLMAQHILMLLQLTMELGNTDLSCELIMSFFSLESSTKYKHYLKEISAGLRLKRSFSDFIQSISEAQGESQAKTIIQKYRNSKRGRRPTFQVSSGSMANIEKIATISSQIQVAS